MASNGDSLGAGTAPRPLGPEDAPLIRVHLASVLESDAFRASERCKQFLTFVVERALDGRQSEIKERIIGVEVFGRPADYETASDSIVRVKANEVRHRLVRYYTGRSGEPIRIELPPGSYVPVIRWTNPEHDLPDASETPATAGGVRSGWRSRRALLAAAVATVGLAVSAAFLRSWKLTGGMDLFWGPVLDCSTAPIIRLPDYQAYMFSKRGQQALDSAAPDATSLPIGPSDYRKVLGFHVSAPTFRAALDLASFLQARGRVPLFRLGADLPPAELRTHPLIAISSRPSEWAMAEASRMRFRFRPVEGPAVSSYMIEDRHHPEAGWRVDAVFPFEAQTSDYALITRVFDSSTRNVSVSVSGLTSFGSQAAAAFLTNPDGWKQVLAETPPDWAKRNIQIVLKTALVGRTPSTAKVVAVHCW